MGRWHSSIEPLNKQKENRNAEQWVLETLWRLRVNKCILYCYKKKPFLAHIFLLLEFVDGIKIFILGFLFLWCFWKFSFHFSQMGRCTSCCWLWYRGHRDIKINRDKTWGRLAALDWRHSSLSRFWPWDGPNTDTDELLNRISFPIIPIGIFFACSLFHGILNDIWFFFFQFNLPICKMYPLYAIWYEIKYYRNPFVFCDIQFQNIVHFLVGYQNECDVNFSMLYKNQEIIYDMYIFSCISYRPSRLFI